MSNCTVAFTSPPSSQPAESSSHSLISVQVIWPSLTCPAGLNCLDTCTFPFGEAQVSVSVSPVVE
jgi:hypothetical protein